MIARERVSHTGGRNCTQDLDKHSGCGGVLGVRLRQVERLLECSEVPRATVVAVVGSNLQASCVCCSGVLKALLKEDSQRGKDSTAL